MINILSSSWDVLCQMAPYLLFGFLAAGILTIIISPTWVKKHLGKGAFAPIFKAAVFGIPLPLCSCSVIPVAASLKKHGASNGATTAFLLSTPQTGVDSILVTYALLGPVFAIFRPIVALITGILGGLGVKFLSNDIPQESMPSCSCPRHRKNESSWRSFLSYTFIELPRDIGFPLILGIIIAGASAALLPPDIFASYLGKGIIGILLMILCGMPLYVCATASIPIAIGLIHLGASPGAALAFLIAGPATNAATLTTTTKLLGIRSTIIYLITILISAVFFGLILNQIFFLLPESTPESRHLHENSNSLISQISAIILLLLLSFSRFIKPEKTMTKT